jgi:hypothetical protein
MLVFVEAYHTSLDGSTLAWGQVNDPGSIAGIRVTRTQSLPGAGPTDNGSLLVGWPL